MSEKEDYDEGKEIYKLFLQKKDIKKRELLRKEEYYAPITRRESVERVAIK